MKSISAALLVITLVALPLLIKPESAHTTDISNAPQASAPAPDSVASVLAKVGLAVPSGIVVRAVAAISSLAVAYAQDSFGGFTPSVGVSITGSLVTATANRLPDAIANAEAQTWLPWPWSRKTICKSTPTRTSPGPGPGLGTKRAIAFCKGGLTVGFTVASDSFDTFIDVDFEDFSLGAPSGGTSSYSLSVSDLGPNKISPDLPPEIASIAEDEGFTEEVPTTSYFSLQVSFDGSTGEPSVSATSFGSPLPDVEDDFVVVAGDPPGIAYVGDTISIPVTLPLGTDVNLDTEAVAIAEQPPAGGGIAEAIVLGSDSAAQASASSSGRDYAAPVAAAAAGVVSLLALTGGGWYARRRWLR